MKQHRPRNGFTLVELLIVIAVIAALASIAVPSMIESRKGANETSAVATLHAVIMAQETYHTRKPGYRFGTMDELFQAGLVDSVVHSGMKSGYNFTVAVVSGGSDYAATAEPQTNSGHRSFYTDASGVIRAAEGASADAASSPIQ